MILSAGLAQGVRNGYEFVVYRRDKFVAKVKVESVDVDSSRARILFTSENEKVLAGDNAATRI